MLTKFTLGMHQTPRNLMWKRQQPLIICSRKIFNLGFRYKDYESSGSIFKSHCYRLLLLSSLKMGQTPRFFWIHSLSEPVFVNLWYRGPTELIQHSAYKRSSHWWKDATSHIVDMVWIYFSRFQRWERERLPAFYLPALEKGGQHPVCLLLLTFSLCSNYSLSMQAQRKGGRVVGGGVEPKKTTAKGWASLNMFL